MNAWLHAEMGLVNIGINFTSMVAAGGVVTLAYLVYGMTGFGSSIVAIPMLTQLVPLRTATPVMLILDLAAGMLVGMRNLKAVQMKELQRLGPWICIGLVLGVTVLVSVSEKPLELLLGVCLLAYSLWRIKSRGEFRQIGDGWALPLGFSGGCLTAVFGTGGPVYTIYLAGRLTDPEQRRATISTLITLTAVARLLLFSISGLYRNPAVLPLAGWLLPCGAMGLAVGARLRNKIPTSSVLTLLWIVLIVAGVNLIGRSAIGYLG
ncbi:hypothetical protein R69746_07708 [Paraburkholderia aspalathi]|uniref:sulfite exporter TauE/SafE family protein n=1 Tax=Paraburkholderia aspalathi TaxID=1324617 RepID=UPI00190E261F|nr:sulfite exporter TauE/SafE family protein [Paraburkholderia aspalathi]MBK3843682.1 sulfite exporter TauE/SafE family protein [Paraburkholderia aspalathi]CAE6832152.1 hypothetical protein R75465_06323 [Paraburkholderia aspalathi]CAE6858713.1 hypothetical protein R69746_07708 [Paraburkholderia aspalathi]